MCYWMAKLNVCNIITANKSLKVRKTTFLQLRLSKMNFKSFTISMLILTCESSLDLGESTS